MSYRIHLPDIRADKPAPLRGWGVGVPAFADLHHMGRWRFGWWYNWWYKVQGPGYPSGGVPMQRGTANENLSRMRTEPGDLWLWGNEPEQHDQDNMAPEDAAAAATQWSEAGGRYAGPGVMVNHMIGLRWLEAWMQALDPAHWPEVLAVHLYTTAEAWTPTLHHFLKWKHVFSWDHIPLTITETAAYGQPRDRQPEVVQQADNALKRGDIYGVAWYAMKSDPGPMTGDGWPWCWLVDEEGEPTPAGSALAKVFAVV